MSYDLIIRNGMVYDGTGAPPRLADIAVQDGKIAKVEAAIMQQRARSLMQPASLSHRVLLTFIPIMTVKQHGTST